MSPAPLPVLTIGHSTRTIPEFVALLRAGDVRLVVDIRRVPRSRTNPQYNEDTLPGELAPYQIGHLRIAALGGLRKKSEVSPAVNGFWTNSSFHNYADYALSDEFRAGFAQLLDVSGAQRAAIMCAEAVWWRCHRRIVADYLMQAGRKVFHLMGKDRVEPAKLSDGAVPADHGIHYPA
jgi:uncharacterized protein (DUF488 family)